MESNKVIILLAIPLAIILAASGYFYLGNEQNIDVTDGYAQLKYSINNTTICMIEKNISAVAVINDGKGDLNLTANLTGSSFLAEDCLEIPIYVYLNVHLPTNIVPSGIEIVAQEMETSNASVDFDMSFNEYMNVTPWPSDKILPGTWAPYSAYIGGTPQKNSFGMITHITWRIWDSTLVEMHTLKIKAELLGLSKPVVSTIVFVVDTSALVMDNE